MDRRKFIGKTTVGAGALMMAHSAFGAENTAETNDRVIFEKPETTREGEMIYRTLGATGEKVSAIGLGGFHISKPQTDDEAVKLVRTAILDKTRSAAMTGKFEKFTTDNRFDGTAKSPKWLGGMSEGS